MFGNEKTVDAGHVCDGEFPGGGFVVAEETVGKRIGGFFGGERVVDGFVFAG